MLLRKSSVIIEENLNIPDCTARQAVPILFRLACWLEDCAARRSLSNTLANRVSLAFSASSLSLTLYFTTAWLCLSYFHQPLTFHARGFTQACAL